MAPEFYTDWGKGEGRGNFLQTRAFSKCFRECKVGTVYGVGSVSSRHNTQALTLSQSPRPIYYYNCGIVFFYQVAAGVTSSGGVDVDRSSILFF